MLGCSRLDGRLPSGLSAWPVPLASDGTSSRVAGVARRVGSMGVSMGKVPRCHGGPVARWSWWERVCDAGTMRGRWHGSVVAERGLPAPLGGGSLVQWFHWFLAPIRFIGPGRQAHRGWSSSWCGVARPSLRSVQVVYSTLCQPCRTAGTGPLDRACGSKAFPFLDRSTGEVGARGASGNSPPRTSEVAHPPEGKRDDGSLAGAFGSSAGQPSTPGTYGGLVCPNLAGRGSTVAQRDGTTLLGRRGERWLPRGWRGGRRAGGLRAVLGGGSN